MVEIYDFNILKYNFVYHYTISNLKMVLKDDLKPGPEFGENYPDCTTECLHTLLRIP